MQEPMLAQREQRQPLVKELFDQSAWMMVILSGVTSAIFWLFAMVGLFVGHGSGMGFYYVLLATLNTLFTFLHLINARFARRLEHKRQAGAWGDQRLLADSQPVPIAQTLALPFTMRMRPHWSKLVAVSASVLLLGAVYWSLFFIFASHAATSLAEHAPALFWCLLASTVLLGPVVFLIMGYSAARQQMTLTEHGIMQVGILARPKSIPWSQVRLFAVRPIFLSRKSSKQSLVSFEVASADETIQWSWALGKGALHILFFARPAVSPADYEQQMRGMLAVIQQRTRLPLVDLRKPL